MRNVKLTIAYDGSNYSGWQRQKQYKTVQEQIENKLSLISGEKIVIHGAGRTDARVHAWGQVASFKTGRQMEPLAWQRALNSMLPEDIVIIAAEEVAGDFHARYSAKNKHYRYRILFSPYPWPFERNYAWHIFYKLNLDAMQKAAALLVGKHDFSSFQATGSHVQSSVRQIEKLAFNFKGEILEMDFVADGFLRHMVRNIVGTLVEVGRGKLVPADLSGILEARDRSQAGPTAPPQGLYLISVSYPSNSGV